MSYYWYWDCDSDPEFQMPHASFITIGHQDEGEMCILICRKPFDQDPKRRADVEDRAKRIIDALTLADSIVEV